MGKVKETKTEESFLRIAFGLKDSRFKGKKKSNQNSGFLFLHEVRDNHAA